MSPLEVHPQPLTHGSPDAPKPREARPLVEMKTQRTLAKAGVLVALGVLVWSGMQRPRRRYMKLHSLTGIALIGFTLWHWSLYMPRPEKRARPARSVSDAAPRRVPSVRAAGG